MYKRLRLSLPEAFVVLLIAGVSITFLIPAVRSARDVSLAGPYIPDTPPSEVRRIHHESGMSLIAPMNWKRAWYHSDQDASWFGVQNGLRYPSKIWIERLAKAFDASHFPDVYRFHGHDCPSRVTIRESTTWDDGMYWQLYRHETIVVHGDETYLVGFETHQDIYELPPMVDKYLQSIEMPET